jgi:hypothetical protein
MTKQFPGFQPLRGHCHCQKTSYTVSAPPIMSHCCHCQDCQIETGTAFSLVIMVESEHVKVEESSAMPIVKDSVTAGGEYRGTESVCGSCGQLLYQTHHFCGDAIMFVRVGTLVNANKLFQPEAHFFVKSKHPWIKIPPGVKAWDILPDSESQLFEGEAKKRIEAARSREKRGGIE